MAYADSTTIDEIDVEIWAKGDRTRHKPSVKHYKVRIDDERFVIDDPLVTGRQLLELAAKFPPEEFLLLQRLANGMLKEIRLDEQVDLRAPGLERFHTFRTDRAFFFMLDGRRFEWGAPFITGQKLKELAGVDPTTFDVWQELHDAEDRLVGDEDEADLTTAGVERFFTGKKTTTEGSGPTFLPLADRKYLESKKYVFEEVTQGSERGVIFRDMRMPQDRFDADKADVLVMLPPGYPDLAPDMFYLLPWVRLVGVNRYPTRADVSHIFLGQDWQRWSRHNYEWRPGIDGIWTMLKRVECALEVAA
ncbi:multiubiquitin domain-containing protein [Nitrospirillum sp. BR 11164]|uniref:multiubiquitin domain-containing protein n=1 Tax=Nitrospirillum sp. BR 11164 TaxID=3104324 RepID=UPI002AFF8674|nr:multiubiquitin domain-containing protein [Nitrospirillum sp. BR 11164]MEA1653022.1 multiubiquitin domain-containing protein [Nitrospirillum sp. BR 11164]